jgi:hypothetical protein
VFLLIDLRWRDSEVLKAGYWLVGRELLTTDSVKRTIHPTLQTRNWQDQNPMAVKSAAFRVLLPLHDSKRDILLVLNLEDTPKHLAPFAIERSRGVILTSVVSAWHSTLAFNQVRAIGRRSCRSKAGSPFS